MYRSLITASKPMLRHKTELAIAVAGLVVMSVCFGAGLGLLLPIFNFLLKEQRTLGELIDSAFNGSLEGFGDALAAAMPTDPFYGFMAVMVGILIMTAVGGVGRFLQTYMIIRVTTRTAQTWRVLLFRKMLRMRMEDYWAYGMSDGASRIMADVESLRSGYHSILVRSAQALLKIFMALLVALIINWQLTALALIGGPAIVYVIRKFGKSIRKSAIKNYKAQAEVLGRINESLNDLRVIKTSQAEGTESRLFMRSSQEVFRQQVRQRRVRAVSSLVVELLAMIGVLVVAGVSAWAIFKQGVPGSQFMTILGALIAAGGSFKPLSNLHHDLTAADAAAQRLLELNDRIHPDSDAKPGEEPRLPRHHQAIRFEKLTYTYPGAQSPALRDVDFEVGFGEMVAVVGGNGSGKSTLVAALARLIKPSSGRVLIDGLDINTHDLRSIRAQMAMVTQKTKLFKGTIADNIAYGRSWTGHDDIVAAAKAATADLFINAMPDGYNTLIGEGGEGVSGGQAQRLCIARAVLRNPAILILDEATSQVDTTSEALIVQAIERITEGRTTFVIAHRMSTIAHADRIVVMDAGQVVGIGRHDELLQTCPQYEALARAQFASLTAE